MTTQTFKLSRTYPVHQYQNWISQTEELIETIPDPENILFWGAIGNGTHDDTTAINEAIAAETSLFFPSGTYLITSTITISKTIRICGENKNTTFIRGNVNPVISIGDGTTSTVPNVEFCNIMFWSNLVYTAGSSVVRVLNLANATWENIRIFGATEHGLYFIPGNSQRVAYNQIYYFLIQISGATGANNAFTIAVTGTGFSNENSYFAGRTLVSTNGTHVRIDNGNYNRFYACTLEAGTNTLATRLGILALSNSFHMCRAENTNGHLVIGRTNLYEGQLFGRMNMAEQISVTGSGTFVADEVITGGTSGATAIVAEVDPQGFGATLTVYSKSAAFTNGEALTGSIVGVGTFNTQNQRQFVDNFVITRDTVNAGIPKMIMGNDIADKENVRFVRQNVITNTYNLVASDAYFNSGNSNLLQLNAARTTGFFINGNVNGTTNFSVTPLGVVNAAGNYQVDAVQVVSNRVTGFNTTVVGAAAATAINATTITATDPNIQALAAMCNAMKSAMITHGLIGA